MIGWTQGFRHKQQTQKKEEKNMTIINKNANATILV